MEAECLYPSAILAEKSVVSCCLQQERLYREALAEGIDAESFHHPGTRIVFQTCSNAERDTNGEVDLVWLVSHLQHNGKLEQAGGSSGVTDIWGFASGGPSGWSAWLDILREMKARRMVVNAAQRLSEASDSTEAIQHTKDTLEALQKTVSSKSRSRSANVCLEEFVDRLREDCKSGDIPGHSTGIAMLDVLCGGMRAGQLWVSAAKPSRGKSALMLQIACQFLREGKRVVIFSLEMEASEIMGRMVTVFGKVDLNCITMPKHNTKAELAKIKLGVDAIKGAKLDIDDTANQSLDTITAEAQRLRDKHGQIDLIVVDYVQLVRNAKDKGKNREQEVAETSGGLKQLAKKMQCPVITGSQLNKEGVTRESEAITQDADALLYILDDGIKIGKLRNGRRDDVLPLFLDGPKQVFREVRQ